MVSAVLSLILGAIGVMGAVVPIPVVLPVLGLALGLNGLIKEKRRAEKRKNVMVMCAIGTILNAIPAVLFALGRLMGT